MTGNAGSATAPCNSSCGTNAGATCCLSRVTPSSAAGCVIHGLDAVESMLWIEGDRVFAESASVIKTTGYLGGWWSRLGRVASLCPAPLLNLMYKVLAKSRRKLMRGSAKCAVPTPDQRSRFLD